MKLIANLLATSIDTRSTAQYEVSMISEAPFEASGALFIDVHPDGTYSGTSLKSGTAQGIVDALVAEYKANRQWWPKHLEIDWNTNRVLLTAAKRRPAEKPRYSSDIPHQELPADVRKAMDDAMNAWARLHAAQARFAKRMDKHYQTPQGGWDRLFGDLGA